MRAPGWYRDPFNRSQHRHWDGSRWAESSAEAQFDSTLKQVESPWAALQGPERRVHPVLVRQLRCGD